MKTKLTIIGILSMFLLSGIASLSVVGTKESLSEQSLYNKTDAGYEYDGDLWCLEPAIRKKEGGLYNCIKIGEDGSQFVEKILKETAVLFVPGWGFGESLRNAIRISYGPLVFDLEKIEIAMQKVGKFLHG